MVQRRLMDPTLVLPTEILTMVLEHVSQPEVLRLARTTQRWRAVAMDSPQFYRPISLGSTQKPSLDPWNDLVQFNSVVREAITDVQPISLNISFARISSSQDFFDVLERDTVPLVAAAMPLVRCLSLILSADLLSLILRILLNPAPLLGYFSTEVIDPRGLADRRSEPSFFTQNVFCSVAPCLKFIRLTGCNLKNDVVDAFSNVKQVEIRKSDLALLPVRLDKLFPSTVKLTIHIIAGPASFTPTPLTPYILTFPPNLFNLRINVGSPGHTANLVRWIDVSAIRVVTLDISGILPGIPNIEWPSIMEGPDRFGSSRFKMVILPQPPRSILSSAVRCMSIEVSSLDCDSMHRRVVRSLAYGNGSDVHNDWNQPPFRRFANLRTLARHLVEISLFHEVLPVLFHTAAELPALRSLAINLDTRRHLFWTTRAIIRPHHIHDEITPSSSGTEESAVDTNVLEVDSLMDTFDHAPETHSLACPVLECLVLRSTMQTIVDARELAHFGRALGLSDDRTSRPHLLLHGGVSLSGGSRLHERIFGDVLIDDHACPFPMDQPTQRP